VGDKKKPLRLCFERQRGVSGRQRVWVTRKDPSVSRFERERGTRVVGRQENPSVSSEGGDEGLVGGKTVPSVSHFKRGRGAPPSHVSSEGGDGGVRKSSTYINTTSS
jgi:hypothetical protein